jgi:hypothetical protein
MYYFASSSHQLHWLVMHLVTCRIRVSFLLTAHNKTTQHKNPKAQYLNSHRRKNLILHMIGESSVKTNFILPARFLRSYNIA